MRFINFSDRGKIEKIACERDLCAGWSPGVNRKNITRKFKF